MTGTDQPPTADHGTPDPSAAEAVADENAPTPKLRADAKAPLATKKRIVAFSDGTGNSSGKLFRTNVYRLYDALDLGNPAKLATQIAYYDNGVGTSSFKPLALLGGIFGQGLKRNLGNLYQYVCRNYNDGDEIYAFGFSRGAFTIRLLVALICSEGIVPYKDERELRRNTADALRRFLGKNEPDNFGLLFRLVRWLRDAVIRGWRALRGVEFNVPAQHRPDIEFVGVWDTVSAYGGPIVEITRGIDQYVWPLTMTDYELHPKVKMARHALALDDERDSFWPLLWDEVAEERAAKRLANWQDEAAAAAAKAAAEPTEQNSRLAAEAAARLAPVTDESAIAAAASEGQWLPQQLARAGVRLKQVWFAGMHSDVGGSYPDDSLAYVSLAWMIGELGKRLDLIEAEANRIRAFANPLGPMHDSRKGLGAYYRYQPRKLAAMLHRSVDDTLTFEQTLVLRDPIIGEEKFRPQGLLTRCRVHRSVIERIALGNDNYAPIVLPRDFAVDPPIGDEQSPFAQALHNLAEPNTAAARGELQENAWDLVWRRRTGYFIVLVLTAGLAGCPLINTTRQLKVDADARLPIEPLFAWGGAFVPDFALPLYVALTAAWPATLLVILAILIVAWRMRGHEADLRDRLRVAWWNAIDAGALDPPVPTRLRRVRTSWPYQAILQVWKWRVLPALFGISLLAVLLLYLPFAIWVQSGLVELERGEAFCGSNDDGNLIVTATAPAMLAASDTCLAQTLPDGGGPARVQRGEEYVVMIDKPDATGGTEPGEWADGRHRVPLEGRASLSFDGWGRVLFPLATPLKRVFMAKWLEPLIEVRGALSGQSRQNDIEGPWARAGLLLGAGSVDARPIAIERLTALERPARCPATRYVGLFTAPLDGALHVFLNDAAWPGPGRPDYFYDSSARSRNRGSAVVTVWRADALPGIDGRCGPGRWRNPGG